MMKHSLSIFLLLLLNVSFGQYSLDDTINNHPFLRMVYFENNPACGLQNHYFEPEELHYYHADKKCIELQDMLKDTMRELFSHKELFEIAQYSKIPFYRIAAFDLYTQTNYSTNSVVRFLKNGCIATNLQVPTRYSVGEIPEGYVSLPCPLTPTLSSIRLKMFEMVDPTATIVTRKPDWSYDTIPKYPENIPLDYESFVELRAYLNSYYNGYTTGVFSMAHSKLPNPSFRMRLDKMDFGKIDLNQIDSDQSGFELRGSILVTNNGNSTIYVSSKASAHTMCLKSTYTIGPKEEVLIEFKSLIDVKNISPSIERSITLQNSKTGEAQLFKFNAQFITK